MKNVLIAFLFVALVGVWSSTAHKKLVELLDQSKAEWRLVEESHGLREGLAAELLGMLQGDETSAKLTAQVKRSANSVKEIRDAFGGKADSSILAASAYSKAQDQLGGSLMTLMEVVGATPRWSDDQGFAGLRKRMVQTTDGVNLAYARFNKAAQDYNRDLETLPLSLYAKHLGFNTAAYLDADLEVRGLANDMTMPTAVPVGAQAAPAAVASPGLELRSKQASANGLLVMVLENGREAGALSRISAIAIADQTTFPADVGFNQEIGESMTTALQEVTKFMKLRHGGWPTGCRMELGFADKYTYKDGPSAAVATALILDSLFTGKHNDDQLAVTGDMNADGHVQPVGGVVAKIRGATKGRCSLVGVPVKNEAALMDLLVMDGIAPFVGIQVFTLQTFDDASKLAAQDKPPMVREAIEDYTKIQELMKRDGTPNQAWLRNKFVLEKLQKIVQNVPNHVSAKFLLMLAYGRTPNTLSLGGSFEGVELAGNDLVSAIKTGVSNGDQLVRNDSLANSILKLKSMRAQLDARTRSYGDALVSLGESVREWQKNPPRSPARASELNSKIVGALRQANAERNLLLNNPTIIEELER